MIDFLVMAIHFQPDAKRNLKIYRYWQFLQALKYKHVLNINNKKTLTHNRQTSH